MEGASRSSGYESVHKKNVSEYIEKHGVSGIEERLKAELDDWKNPEIKIGVTGNSGDGKSSFINAIRGVYTSATTSGAAQAADHVSDTPAAQDTQPTEPASGVPPGNAQTARDISEIGINIPPGDEQTTHTAPVIPSIDTGEAVVVDVPPEDEQATEEDVEQERNPKICDIIFKITATAIKVIDISFEGLLTSAAAANVLADILAVPTYKLLLAAAIFRTVRTIKQNAAEIRNIVAGCLQCEVRCFTEDIFLEVLRDHETGKIKKRLEEEYLKAGYKMTELEVKIQNSEEVERTKTAIEKRLPEFISDAC